MALGFTIRRYHAILAAFLLLYNVHSCVNSKIKEKQATLKILKKCMGRTPSTVRDIIDNPEDAYRFVSSAYPNEDCIPISKLYRELIYDDDYFPKILNLENKGFMKKYGFESHKICTFNENGKIGSIDNIFGYIKPQNNVEDIVKIIEKKANIRRTKYHYIISEEKIEDIMQHLKVFPYEKIL